MGPVARLPLVLSIVAVACVSATAPSPTSSLPVGAAAVGPTTTTLAATDAVAGFVDCMASQGVVVDGLRIDATGHVALADLAKGRDPTDPGFRRALGRCGALLVDAGLMSLAEDPELASTVLGELRQFTSCVRAEGVEGFPPPSPRFDGTGPAFDPEAIPYDDPDLAAALEVCRSRLASE